MAGNKTFENAGSIGLEGVIVVQTDGTKLVASSADLDLAKDARAKGLAIADNRAGLEWDPEVLTQLWERLASSAGNGRRANANLRAGMDVG
jgi:hypothetical protein